MTQSSTCRQSLWIGIVAVLLGFQMLCAAPAQQPPIPAVITNAIARDILRDLHPSSLRDAHVLIFVALVDDRPLWVDHALVVTKMSRGRWELWFVARNGKPSETRAPWSEFTVTDSTQRGWQSYHHRPTAADVEAFLKLSRWSVAAETPFRVVRTEMDPNLWKAVLGFEPKAGWVPPRKP